MRDIKFRGLCDNGIMRCGRLSQDKENSTMYYETHSQRICWDCSNIPVSNISLGQFTGMTDGNGTEVYEGDWFEVVGGDLSDKNVKVVGVVIFRHGCFIVEYTDPVLNEYRNFMLYRLLRNKNKVIIGNIHENSALLTN